MPRLLFRTQRLLVRQLSPNDVESMFEVYSDADAMRWVGDGQPITRDECDRWLKVTEKNYATRGYGMSVLELRETGDAIGFCGLVHPGGQTEVEIKYALLRGHWGRGLATEVVEAMISYGSREFGMTRIIAGTASENVASHRVLLKAGMQPLETSTNNDGTVSEFFVWQAADPD